MQRIVYLVSLVAVMAASAVALTQWPDAPVQYSASSDVTSVTSSSDVTSVTSTIDVTSVTYGDEASLVVTPEGPTASITTATAYANTTLETITSAETAATLALSIDARHRGTRPPGTRPPTATTQPPTTTLTTEPPTTTLTTQPPTTTTTTAPTTTNTQPTSDIPDTIISPTGSQYAYPFSVIEAEVEIWWSAPYVSNLPYQDGYGWGVGDRISYTCQYGHLLEGGVDTGGNVDGGLPVGRFVVSVLPESSGYMMINGAGQGHRWFDGTENTGAANQLYSNSFCFDLDGIFHGGYQPSDGVAETPVIVFRNAAGAVVEIRDYRNTTVRVPGVHFQLIDSDGTDGTVSVAAYSPDRIPGAVVYYTGLNGGTVEAFLP